MAVLSSKEWTSLSHTKRSLTSSTDSLTADKIRVLRIDTFRTLAIHVGDFDSEVPCFDTFAHRGAVWDKTQYVAAVGGEASL